MFIDTLGSGSKTVVRTQVDATPSSQLIRCLHPDRWMCIHTLGSKKTDEDLVAPVYSQAMVLNDKSGTRVVLLANTRNVSVNVTVQKAAGGMVRSVDLDAGLLDKPYSEDVLVSDDVALKGFAVAIVRMPPLRSSQMQVWL